MLARRTLAVGGCLFGCLILTLVAPLAAQPQFTDVTIAAGVGAETYTSNTAHGLGALWIDFNRDGWVDLFVVNGKGDTCHLYQNDGGTFSNADHLLPALPDIEMPGASFADYDNDGDSDIYIFTDNEFLELFDPINPADGPLNLLLKNLWVENGGALPEGGAPLFEEVAATALVDDARNPPYGPYPGWRSSTGGWVDYDRDGWVDLYVAHWVTAHSGEGSNRDRLYRNEGDGTFSIVSASSGIQPGNDPNTYRPALAFVAGHLDQDLWPEIYVGNVQGPPPFHYDFLFRNQADGTFVESTGDSPGMGDDAAAAMGIDIADIDLDADWDFYITDINGGQSAPPAGNVLYVNNGDGTFQDNSAPAAGVVADTSWPTNFFDVDHDGYEDLYVGSADQIVDNFLYVNNGDGTFTDVSTGSGVETPMAARGSATADYDNDGDLDLVVVNRGNRLQLLRNDTPNQGNWLKLRLTGNGGNGDAIGAVVKVRAGALQMQRQIVSTSSAHSQDGLDVHFGLGAAAVAEVVQIQWPNGVQQILDDVTANQLVEISEPDLPAVSFTDVTAGAGLAFAHGYAGGIDTKQKRIAGGFAVGDYDGDGWLDLYMVRGTIGPNLLFHNLGNGTFEEVGAAAGVAVEGQFGSGPRFIDLDGDGLLDLMMGGVDGSQPRVYENQGDGTFANVSGTANITSGRASFSPTFADIDRDGDVDVALTHWGPGDEPCTAGIPCGGHIWLNDGGFAFTEADVATGVVYPVGGKDHTFAPSFGDINGDLWPDLVIGSDFGTSVVYLNDGDGTFTDITDHGVVTDENAMGSFLFDLEQDGDLDWFVTSIFGSPFNPNFETKTGNRLYRGFGDGTFENVTDGSGVRVGDWGWGPCAADFDNDGNTDIFHVNGWIQPGFITDLSRLFYSHGDGTFSEMSVNLGVEDPGQGRGVSCADYDRDGDIDLLIFNNDQMPKLFRNDGGNAKSFLNISLKGRTANTEGIGAKVTVALDDLSVRHAEMTNATSFVSQLPSEIHLGVGDATLAEEIQVLWPDGILNTYTDVAVDQFVELKQFYDSIGVYVPGAARFNLRNANTRGSADISFNYGQTHDGTVWYPLTGDWNGDGLDTPGVYRKSIGKFRLRDDNSSGRADYVFKFGVTGPDVTPIAGDWDGDGTDTIGIHRSSARAFLLRNTNTGGGANVVVRFGPTGWMPVMGDWNGDGIDTVGVYDPATGDFQLRNSNTDGAPDLAFQFGPVGGGLPVAGDWDGDGIDTVGVYEIATATFFLINQNAAGAADLEVRFGGNLAGTLPLVGMWN